MHTSSSTTPSTTLSGTSVVKLLVSVPAGLLLALGTVACAPEVPANPTWEDDVRPILAANCVRCHRSEPQNFAPNTFDLSVCEDAGTVLGASAQATRVIARAQGQGAQPMPPEPGAQLSDRQIEVIENWQANGAPCNGGGSNAAPSFALLRSLDDSLLPGARDLELALRYEIDDRNGDPVDARLFAIDDAGALYPIADALTEGVGEVRWTLSDLGPGRYQIIAELDDGEVIHEHSVGTLTR